MSFRKLFDTIKASATFRELHYLADEAKKDWDELFESHENLAKMVGGEAYEPVEYPKMLPDGTVVRSKAEEDAHAAKASVGAGQPPSPAQSVPEASKPEPVVMKPVSAEAETHPGLIQQGGEGDSHA